MKEIHILLQRRKIGLTEIEVKVKDFFKCEFEFTSTRFSEKYATAAESLNVSPKIENS